MAGEIRGDDHKKIIEHYQHQQVSTPGGKTPKVKGTAKGEAAEKVPGDRIISSKDEGVSGAQPLLKPSEPRDPKLPPPSTREIKDESIKKEMTPIVEVNPWMANPSYMGAFLSKLGDLFLYTSDQRFQEAGLKRTVDTATFKGRMESADLAKMIKDTEAQKMFLDAAKSFVSAGIGVLQAKSMSDARKTAEKKSGESFDEGIKKSTKKLETLQDTQKKLDLKQKQQKPEGAVVHVSQEQGGIKAQDPLKEKIKLNKAAIEKTEEKITDLTTKKDQTSQQTVTREIEQSRQKFEIFKQLTESAFSVSGGIFTMEIGTKEKERAQIEAFVDLLNKMAEGINKAREDLPQMRDKLLQIIEDTSRQNIQSHLQKG